MEVLFIKIMLIFIQSIQNCSNKIIKHQMAANCLMNKNYQHNLNCWNLICWKPNVRQYLGGYFLKIWWVWHPRYYFTKTDKCTIKNCSREDIDRTKMIVMQLQAMWLIHMICHDKHTNQKPGKFVVCHYKRSRLISLKFDCRAERNAPAK
jgi:hypothetical protein